MRILRGPEQAPLPPLADKTVAVLGYGNQGHAHALNLRDSGVHVIVGAAGNSRGAARAAACGFAPRSISEATAAADLVIIALPDEVHPEIYEHDIEPNVRESATLGFLHGFSIRYKFMVPRGDLGVIMLAPKGPGTLLRQRFIDGLGLPCLFAVHQDSARSDAQALGLAWANAIGCARAAIVCTSLAHEAETDLFGEQAVLCGGLSALIIAAFDILVESGYPPELAYMECCQEVKQIADLVYERGLAGMRQAISNTAEFGAYRAGAAIVDEQVRSRLREILHSVQDGSFAAAMRADRAAGFPWFHAQRTAAAKHPIEQAGAAVRAWMPWLGKKSLES